MKKSKCDHSKVKRIRGPQEVYVLSDPESIKKGRPNYEGWAKVVWEVCLKCNRYKRIPFLTEKSGIVRIRS